MEMISNCENCFKEFIWKKQHKNFIRKYCSHTCALVNLNKKQSKWNDLTYDERLEILREKFEKKVIKKVGCWDWKGYRDAGGYGSISGTRTTRQCHFRSHRVSYEIHKGPIPNGILVCHTCDNRICTNPEHLFLGTHKENSIDAAKKGRMSRGEARFNATLTENDVRNIRKMIENGIPQRQIAFQYGVSPVSILNIKIGKTWKHVKD